MADVLLESNAVPVQPAANKPYDNAFKTIIRYCPNFVVPLINEMFHETGLTEEVLDGSEPVVFLDKEFSSPDGTGQIIEDFRLRVMKPSPLIYHLECESSAGNHRVFIRLMRYDFASSIDDAQTDESGIHIRFDCSGILFLRSNGSTPSLMPVTITAPDGQSLSYRIPALKIQDYTLDDLVEKKLYVLIPFLLFNHEDVLKQLKNNENASPESLTLLAARRDEFHNILTSLIERVEELTRSELITGDEEHAVRGSLNMVLNGLCSKYNVQKEVGEIMGGTVVEIPSVTAYRNGEKEGKKEGKKEGEKIGEERGEILATWKYVTQGLISAEKAAEDLGMTVSKLEARVREFTSAAVNS